jgi:DNA-binding transcriptional ArsR family regulator
VSIATDIDSGAGPIGVDHRRPMASWAPGDYCWYTGTESNLNQMVDKSGQGRKVNHMVDDLEGTDAVFHALAHGARRDMLERLAGGELTVGELAEPLAMSLAAASKHVKVLELAGLVRRTVQGRRHMCRLETAPLASASAWLSDYERHWSERLDALQVMFPADPQP